jgi:phage I-like protein
MVDLAGASEGNDAPEWIHVMQAGRFTLHDGRGPFALKDPQAVAAASRRETVDLVIDRDHQIQLAPRGTPIKAAGWIKQIEARADGLWARVEWTASAAAEIAAKEYRYISPVFNYDKKTGEILRITHASLTNDPAMELTAVASREPSNPEEEEDHMNKTLTAIAALLGLGNPDTEETVLAAAQKHVEKAKEDLAALGDLRRAIGVAEDADQGAALSAATALASNKKDPSPADYVPMKVHQELASQLSRIQHDLKADKAEAAVAEAMKAGKVSPAQKEWAVAYARADLDGFGKFVAAAPVIVPAGQSASGAPPRKEGELDETQQAICKNLGISAEQFSRTAA